ncbi:MAG TPA: MFS transporter [Acidimicrobiales bacterium]|nr:MFS transporter [Acidimicrobiales bacterium]
MRTRGSLAAGTALVVVALNLRIAIAALSPVLSAIQRSTGLSSAGSGLLTAVPVICFGAIAFTAPGLIRRFGINVLLGLTLIAVIVGSGLRLVPSLAALFVGTAVVGAGIAVANVLLPGLIKRDFSGHSHLMTALYSMCLYVGAALSTGLTVPLEHATGMDWRQALALWGGAAAVGLIIWAPSMRGEPPAATAAGQARPDVRGLWSDPVAWQVTVFMGLQSFGYYATLSWLPTFFEAHHLSSTQAGWMLSFSAFPGMAAALLTPALGRRLHRSAVLVALSVGLSASAYVGLLAAPIGGRYAWMLLLGFGQGVAISLALGYIVARAPDTHHAAHLSTMAQGVGYLIACTGPFSFGAIHGLTGGWHVPLVLLLAVLVPLLVAGVGASRPRHVLAGARAADGGRRPSEALAPE